MHINPFTYILISIDTFISVSFISIPSILFYCHYSLHFRFPSLSTSFSTIMPSLSPCRLQGSLLFWLKKSQVSFLPINTYDWKHSLWLSKSSKIKPQHIYSNFLPIIPLASPWEFNFNWGEVLYYNNVHINSLFPHYASHYFSFFYGNTNVKAFP